MGAISIAPRNKETSFRQLIEQHGSPLLVLDCNVLRQQYRRMKKALPNVEIHYAIKSLPDTTAMATLASEGASFDLATTGEIELMRRIGANPSATIHTHPVKRDQDIRDALQYGCNTFVVDNIDELLKFQDHRSRAELLLRVSFRGQNVRCDLSRKFGCELNDVPYLLVEAAKHGIRVKGLSFHVGSQSPNSENHVAAIEACLRFFTDPKLLGAEHLSVLDIGGGFPADYALEGLDLEAFCAPIAAALARYPANVRFISEPGRYLSAPCVTAIGSVMGRAQRGGLQWYYLDDGVYGSYSGQIFDHASYPMTVFSDDTERHDSVLAGPTCDSIDVITEMAQLPPLAIGDLVVGQMMGAYTLATACEFNSIPKPKLIAINAQLAEEENLHYLFAERA
jgi:ornithine decarboxylase